MLILKRKTYIREKPILIVVKEISRLEDEDLHFNETPELLLSFPILYSGPHEGNVFFISLVIHS